MVNEGGFNVHIPGKESQREKKYPENRKSPQEDKMSWQIPFIIKYKKS